MTTEAAKAEPRDGGASDDLVLAFRTLNSRAQGRVVRLGPAIDEILSRHDFPEVVSRIVGEAAALTAMLGSLLHTNGRLILQTKSDGPVSMLVADYTRSGDAVPGLQSGAGRMRATATFDAVRLAELLEGEAGAGLPAGQGLLLGKGHLAMTIDPGGGEPRTQGIVALDNHSLSQAALTYFDQSEQIPTFVRLAVARHQARPAAGAEPVWRWRAGGLIVQQLPEDVGHGVIETGDETGDETGGDAGDSDREEDWQRVRLLAATVEDHELTDPMLAPERLLYRLFHEEGVRVAPPVAVEAHCGCTRERVELLLEGFGRNELDDMLETDGGVTVKCEYCGKSYRFSPAEIDAM